MFSSLLKSALVVEPHIPTNAYPASDDAMDPFGPEKNSDLNEVPIVQDICKLEMFVRGVNTSFEEVLPIAVFVYGTERRDSDASALDES